MSEAGKLRSVFWAVSQPALDFASRSIAVCATVGILTGAPYTGLAVGAVFAVGVAIKLMQNEYERRYIQAPRMA